MSESLFTTQTPALTDISDSGQRISVGTLIQFVLSGTVSGIRWYAPATASDVIPHGTLYQWVDENTGTVLGEKDFSGVAYPGWNTVTFDTPVPVSAGQYYVASVWCNRYTATPAFFTTPLSNGNIIGVADGTGHANGKFIEPTVSPAYPNSSFNSNCYFADVLFTADANNFAGQTVWDDNLFFDV